jgi:quercetin dioxygenase-like cupin family protein
MTALRKVHENPIYGDKAVFLKTSEETGGTHTLIEIELSVGGGNDLHYHKSYQEKFTVVEGEITLIVDKKSNSKVLKIGDSFVVSPGVVHCFKNKSDMPAKFLVEFQPGQPGFEQTLMIGYGLAKDGFTNKKGIPKKFSHLALLITLSDTHMPGVFSLLLPIFRWSANAAKKRGELKELVSRYCS